MRKPFYIATQGPLKDTIAAFWHMCVNNNTRRIVQVTGFHESHIPLGDGQTPNKCAFYFPQKSGAMISESKIEPIKFKVENIEITEASWGLVSILRLTVLDMGNF